MKIRSVMCFHKRAYRSRHRQNHENPNPSANRPDYGLSFDTISESSTDELMRNHAFKIAIFKGFRKCAF